MIDLLARRLANLLAGHTGTRLIGITGGVAAGKSTLAHALVAPLEERLGAPVQVVGSDGFLHDEERLRARGILGKKGFPESHDHAAIARFAESLESSQHEVSVPVYSHAEHGVVSALTVALPSVLIVEGVFAFAVLRATQVFGVRLYLDASEQDLERWFLARYAHLLADESERVFAAWNDVNLPNLRQHILAERASADVVVRKFGEHELSLV